MNSIGPIHHVIAPTVSDAWAQAVTTALRSGAQGLMPLYVTIAVDPALPIEDPAIRRVVDPFLAAHGRRTIRETANTIFPISLWCPERPRIALYQRYLQILPRLGRLDRANRYGTYFGRAICYGSAGFNQLEHLITTYEKGNHRASALQLSIFDPHRDHTDQRRRGFPCLQQVNFLPHGKGEMEIVGFYAVQHLIDRAYGNYLGLYNLGRFVACELGLKLTQVSCMVLRAEMGSLTKSQVRPLTEHLGCSSDMGLSVVRAAV